ncbi:CU044_2847 family protein [Micromonospora chokoriensis]|uniref:CU044_2847 family protein n=1 Tax=Micromonospora chokoriensis TaxID=356851 RepID=UPI0004C39311|nr:CU044_2847 family protein [Micromonospora chokoriensis]
MGKKLLRVPIGNGTDDVIEVEVDVHNLEGVELASERTDGPDTAAFSLAASLGRVLPAISTMLATVRNAEHAPDEVSMELGLTIGGETGIIFTKGTAEANFVMTMAWRRPA